MEENMVKFEEKLKELLAMAKKKKNILEYQEINDFFHDMELDAEHFEKILEYLEAHNIDVLRITSDDDDDEIILTDEDEVDVEQIDLSVPEGVSIEDPAGREFDPSKHNAVMHIDSEELGENVVSQVFQKGFLLGEKVIRFATVQVAN